MWLMGWTDCERRERVIMSRGLFICWLGLSVSKALLNILANECLPTHHDHCCCYCGAVVVDRVAE